MEVECADKDATITDTKNRLEAVEAEKSRLIDIALLERNSPAQQRDELQKNLQHQMSEIEGIKVQLEVSKHNLDEMQSLYQAKDDLLKDAERHAKESQEELSRNKSLQEHKEVKMQALVAEKVYLVRDIIS